MKWKSTYLDRAEAEHAFAAMAKGPLSEHMLRGGVIFRNERGYFGWPIILSLVKAGRAVVTGTSPHRIARLPS
jgi:hypothetical protein